MRPAAAHLHLTVCFLNAGREGASWVGQSGTHEKGAPLAAPGRNAVCSLGERSFPPMGRCWGTEVYTVAYLSGCAYLSICDRGTGRCSL